MAYWWLKTYVGPVTSRSQQSRTDHKVLSFIKIKDPNKGKERTEDFYFFAKNEIPVGCPVSTTQWS